MTPAVSAMSTAAPAVSPGFREPAPSPLLHLLGSLADPDSERGVECAGALPAASDPDLVARAERAKAALGDRVFILGHHYQRDEVIALADTTGDSFRLAQQAAARPGAEFIVFCGVHFMAESADILTAQSQQVILPDLSAGCSMADMASIEQVTECWATLTELGLAEGTVPVVYMNSSAAIKAFTGREGGTVCTSSNAAAALRWAFSEPAAGGRGAERVLFLPDQHLGRNTAMRQLGFSAAECAVYDPRREQGGLTTDELAAARMLLWRGHCSVHGRFTPDCVAEARERLPGVQVLVHPECTKEVVDLADHVGSTEFIIATIEAAAPGTSWVIGTELNLVRRLARTHPDKSIAYLDRTVCFCATMNRIDLPHLVMSLEALAAGHVLNRVRVDGPTAAAARAALDQMLALPGDRGTAGRD